MSATAELVTTQQNPFGIEKRQQSALVEAKQQREIAEVQAAMVIAKRFPRDPIAAMDRILQACTRPTLAGVALYSYSRGGSEVTGPSIRMAEVLAQSWGNIDFGIRELEQRDGESTVEAYAWDIETNTRQVKTFQVAHERHTRQGVKRLTDPRDIYELVANQGARRLRACILGVIPGDVQEAAIRQCEETLRASADTSPEGLRKILEAFKPFGVSKSQIEKRIQCRFESIRPAQVVQLRKVLISIKDGMSSPADWFDAGPEIDAAMLVPADPEPKAIEATATARISAEAIARIRSAAVESGILPLELESLVAGELDGLTLEDAEPAHESLILEAIATRAKERGPKGRKL